MLGGGGGGGGRELLTTGSANFSNLGDTQKIETVSAIKSYLRTQPYLTTPQPSK